MTWSILVRDPATGALGAAVASRFFAVGAMCIHVEGGIAALSTQALVNPMYAVHAMPRLRAGEPADAVLASLVEPDPGADQRQFHIIDAGGLIAQHTGPNCVTWSGHVRGQDVSVAGNMLSGPAVVQRTVEAYLGSAGSLAERLIYALEAGEAAGGDRRGKQSADSRSAPATRIRTSTSVPTTITIRSPSFVGCIASAWSASRCSGASCLAGTANGARWTVLSSMPR